LDWLSLIIVVLFSAAGLVLLAAILFTLYILCNYSGIVTRIFEEKPLFIIPKGEPIAGAEDVRFRTRDGLTLAGSYLKTPLSKRRGVVLFGPEFGSNRWSCHAYCGYLLEYGFDVFTFEFRNHGESEIEKTYEPLQWVTDRELTDIQAAIEHLKKRPDADSHGIGFLGVSRGGGAGLLAAAEDPWIRCVVTDGAFASVTTVVPYMKKWVAIYIDGLKLQHWLPRFFFWVIAVIMLRRIGRRRGCHYPSLERAIARIAPRPLFVIHGEKDTYIKPDIARKLFDFAREPKAFWLVPSAKHNQALHVAAEDYQRRVLEFFVEHLATEPKTEAALASMES
jgi:pimeloyl-ACP methyl ester carboxylesterase